MNIKQLFPEKLKFLVKWILSKTKRLLSNILTNNHFAYTISLSDEDRPTFFGYHDKTPFSLNGNKILAMSINTDDTKPENESSVMKIGYFKKDQNGIFSNEFIPLAETTTWCYQQGCMLQWNPLLPDEEIFYNTLINGKYGSVAFNIAKKQIVKEFNHPIYSVAPNGKLAATLNFSRLGWLRPGYGYNLFPDDNLNNLAPGNDGLFIFELDTMKKQLLLSLANLAEDISSTNNYYHYVNHATFSPNGKRILFFHIWSKGNKEKRFHRVCEFNLTTGRWKEIERERILSHYCWKDENSFLGTTLNKEGKWQYSMYNLKTNRRNDLNLSLKNGDGHPMFHPLNKNIIVTDTYPDKWREQHLLTVNISSKKNVEIAKFYSPFKYSGQVRCDLHPRWDREGKYVAVDSTHNGKRQMIITTI